MAGELKNPRGGTIEEYASDLFSFLRERAELIDMTSITASPSGKPEKAVHFFNWDHWTRRVVDPAWRDWFEAGPRTTADEGAWIKALLDVQSGRWKELRGAPDSLVGFVRTAAELAPELGGEDGEAATSDGRRRWDEGPMKSVASAQDAAMALMTQKKKHEVRALGEFVSRVSEQASCDAILDVGAGKGYLTQYLSIHSPSARVVAVEGSESNAESFKRRADVLRSMVSKAETTRKKKKTGGEREGKEKGEDGYCPGDEDDEEGQGQAAGTAPGPNASVIAARVPLGVDAESFIRSLNLVGKRVLLTGLHTCGDLAPTILKLFLRSPESRALVLVGCCYHMMTERTPFGNVAPQAAPSAASQADEAEFGFPLSSFLKSRMNFFLDTGRHLASNVLPQFMSVDEFKHSMMMHSYRAALELFLNRKANTPGAEPQPHHVGNMRSRYADMSFGMYVVRAVGQLLRKLPSYSQVSPSYKDRLAKTFEKQDLREGVRTPLAEEADSFYQSMGPTASGILPQVACFAALRNLLGPLVEALVLADRFLFLRERGSGSLSNLSVVRLFTPDISPRSFAIVAVKGP